MIFIFKLILLLQMSTNFVIFFCHWFGKGENTIQSEVHSYFALNSSVNFNISQCARINKNKATIENSTVWKSRVFVFSSRSTRSALTYSQTDSHFVCRGIYILTECLKGATEGHAFQWNIETFYRQLGKSRRSSCVKIDNKKKRLDMSINIYVDI